MPRFKYVGPSDPVEALGLTFSRNHPVEVTEEQAGHAPHPRHAELVQALKEATDARDHQRSRDLREAIIDLGPDALGSGLRAQSIYVEVAPKAKHKEDDQ